MSFSLKYLFILGITTLLSCSENDNENASSIQVQPVSIVGNRLNFATKEVLKNYIAEIIKSKHDPKSILEHYIGKNQFVSLKHFCDLKVGSNLSSISSDTSEIEADTLIVDPYFIHVLNKDSEIQVEGTLYKITRYGTYIAKPEKGLRINEILQNLKNRNFEFSSTRIIPGEIQESEKFYFVESGIYRLDSFDDTNSIEVVYPKVLSEVDKNTARETTDDLLPQYIYDQFPTFNFDAKTWAGELIQDVFGRTKSHTQKFDSKHRVKVNFYNVNFGVYASAGINVKMQRRGWTGIWRETDTDELRLGWDGLIIDLMLPNAQAPDVPTVDFGKITLGDIDFNTHSITVGGFSIPKGTIDDALNGALEGTFKSGLKELYNYAFVNLAPGQFYYQEGYVKMFRVIYPDRIKMVLGRYEVAEEHTNSITKVFDWNVGFTIKWNPSGNTVNAQDFNASGSATAYKIVSGSVYGAAYYDNQWKGAGVDKK